MLSIIFLRAIRHVVYVDWTQLSIVYELVAHSSTTVFLGWLQIRPRIRYLKYCNHLVTNQRSVCNERVGELSNSFEVIYKRRRPTEDQSTSDYLPIMCELIATISTVRGITCGDWRYQLIPQFITERLSIYSSNSSNLLFHRFQSLGPFLWFKGRYHFWVLVIFLHFLMMTHCAYIGELNIKMHACAPNPLEIFDVVNNSSQVRLSHC